MRFMHFIGDYIHSKDGQTSIISIRLAAYIEGYCHNPSVQFTFPFHSIPFCGLWTLDYDSVV